MLYKNTDDRIRIFLNVKKCQVTARNKKNVNKSNDITEQSYVYITYLSLYNTGKWPYPL